MPVIRFRPGYVVIPVPYEESPAMMPLLLSPLFWDKKLKIAILTFATFAALC